MGFRNAFDFTLSYIFSSIFRFCQLALALSVCGLYGVDLSAARKQGKYSDGKWIYAEVVGAFAAVTALLYMIPFVMRVPFMFVWDTILFILWIALFGVFGNLFIHAHAAGVPGVQRMKNAVWVDLVNALLWLISAIAMGFYWFGQRQKRSQFTGRAAV
ncbi:hypothetical protein B7463_g6982, partial [Scytalidium lignicola]